jgi:hypothetical protein
VNVSSIVNMNDPDTADQLLGGFYQVEDNRWRWAAPKFSVALRPKGNHLVLKFNIPEALLQQGPATLSASAADQPLPPQTYTSPGNQTYERDIPITTGNVVVNFECNRKLAPTNGDTRELALIVVSVSLSEP